MDVTTSIAYIIPLPQTSIITGHSTNQHHRHVTTLAITYRLPFRGPTTLSPTPSGSHNRHHMSMYCAVDHCEPPGSSLLTATSALSDQSHFEDSHIDISPPPSPITQVVLVQHSIPYHHLPDPPFLLDRVVPSASVRAVLPVKTEQHPGSVRFSNGRSHLTRYQAMGSSQVPGCLSLSTFLSTPAASLSSSTVNSI